jgi:hypothetical protein
MINFNKKLLIWGFANTKKLRTDALDKTEMLSIKNTGGEAEDTWCNLFVFYWIF